MRFDYKTIDTKQKLVDAVKQYFTETKEQCAIDYNDKTQCLYRYEHEVTSPRTCIAGAFIPDSLYTPDMEGDGVVTLTNLPDLEFYRWAELHLVFLESLQGVHDKPSSWSTNGDGITKSAWDTLNHLCDNYLKE